MHKYSYVYLNIFNITRIANAVQRHSLLSGHYDCNVLRFSIVRNVKSQMSQVSSISRRSGPSFVAEKWKILPEGKTPGQS